MIFFRRFPLDILSLDMDVFDLEIPGMLLAMMITVLEKYVSEGLYTHKKGKNTEGCGGKLWWCARKAKRPCASIAAVLRVALGLGAEENSLESVNVPIIWLLETASCVCSLNLDHGSIHFVLGLNGKSESERVRFPHFSRGVPRNALFAWLYLSL